jgi:predicted GNAT family N-acyltransferase
MDKASLRDYRSQDRASCIAVCASNVPAYFTAADLDDFTRFLASTADPYFVLEHGQRIVGCGGIYLKSPTVAAMSWGMVHAGFHGRGAGAGLLLGRLTEIAKRTQARSVVLNTTEATRPFFAKYGFTVAEIREDGYGKGVNLAAMSLVLPSRTERT